MSDKIKFTKSSGNVYEDMGFKDAKERLVKADLAIKLNNDNKIHHETIKND